MRRIFFRAFLVFSLVGPAHADELGLCPFSAKLGSKFVELRQNNVPLVEAAALLQSALDQAFSKDSSSEIPEEVLSSIERLLTGILVTAYELPLVDSAEDREYLRSEFENQVMILCMKRMSL